MTITWYEWEGEVKKYTKTVSKRVLKKERKTSLRSYAIERKTRENRYTRGNTQGKKENTKGKKTVTGKRRREYKQKRR
jgi:hypothetical protein